MKNTNNSAWGPNKFDKKFLNKLNSDINSGVFVQKIQHHLSLHPIHLHNLKESIKDCLNEGLAKYNKRTDGIVLGYQNVILLSDKGVIVNDSCYIHVDLSLEFFIFKPEIGKELRGVVNRKSKSHIGILVYDTFNVSIPKPKNDDNWLGNDVNIGQEVSFKISRINLLSHLPYIEGQLASVASDESNTQKIKGNKNTKLIFSDDNSDEIPKKKLKKNIKDDSEESPTKKNKKRKRGAEEEELFQDDNINLENSLSNKETTKKKRKLKDKRMDESELIIDTMMDNTFQKKSKKKKSKKSQSNEEFGEDASLSNTAEPTKHKKKLKKKDIVEEELENNETKSPKKKRKGKQNNEESFSDFYLTQLFEDSN